MPSKTKGWVGSFGTVSNLFVWEMMLSEWDKEWKEVIRTKILSHATAEGNNQVDWLTAVGLYMHHLYLFSNARQKAAFVPSTPPPPIKRARITLYTPVRHEVLRHF